MENRRLTAEALPIFQEGIGLVMSQWWALLLAAEEAGVLEVERFHSDVFSFFTNHKNPLDVYDLEILLEESMVNSFNTGFEEGSREIEEVARELMRIYEECLEGNYQSIERLRTRNPPREVNVTPVNGNDDDDDDNDNDSDDFEDNDVEDEDDDNIGDDNATTMEVDVPNPTANPNLVDVPTGAPDSRQAAEAGDGWLVVSSRRNRGRRN